MINYTNSSWGIKYSSDDITTDIIGLISSANKFIIIGGYNFTFKTSGFTFFNELRRKSLTGVPILMILPPNLTAYTNNQQRIIDFCVSIGIGVILNGSNHSKWILTDRHLYYGSSNFSETSWTKKIEVITIHHHHRIRARWKDETIFDFKNFVKHQIKTIKRRKRMITQPNLIIMARIKWNEIKSQMLRLNPSIEKVVQTLENYDKAILILEEISALWFLLDNDDAYAFINKLNRKILRRTNRLCNYAYNHIYNESVVDQSINDFNISSEQIEIYNGLHSELVETINKCQAELENFDFQNNEKNDKNLHNLNIFLKLLENN